MWSYPEIDPVALSLGPLQIHWYGLMYLAGFAFFYFVGMYRAKSNKDWNADMVSDFLFYGALGVIIGGRVGYILFYEFASYSENPLNILKVWEGGMSFHGGIIGVAVAMWLFARKQKMSVWTVADFVAPLVPAGLFFGRMGNFINGELWGRVTESSWGMKAFDPRIGEMVNRYPTQLLEALLEGLVLLIILWVYSAKPRPAGAVAGLFIALYGLFRFFVEFYRAPDAHIGYLMGDWLTMGHILSTPMILIGLGIVVWAYRQDAQRKNG